MNLGVVFIAWTWCEIHVRFSTLLLRRRDFRFISGIRTDGLVFGLSDLNNGEGRT